MALDSQMLKGAVSLMLLALISEHEDYGYALVERLRGAGMTDMTEGTVYPALARLERAGHAETYHVPSGRGPARKYYRISPAGAAELRERLIDWRHIVDVVADITKEIES